MSETPDSNSEENAPPSGPEGAETAPVESFAETMEATIRVNAPVPRTGASSQPRGWQPPSVEQLQQMLPQYDVTSFIARGGMGAVYKGSQKALKRPVAIKVLPPEIEDGDLQFSERFKHEAQSMARLTHPNIVAVFDAGETPDGLLYFVMEFVEGTDVAQLISSEGLLEPKRAIDITVAVCEALAFAHEEGIVHRDIKPSNIMIDKRGRVKVADFGLAKSLNVEATLLTGTNMAMGTPDFIAPEALIPGIKIDGRADLYAVGVMLYQMLTGKIPRGRFHLPSGVVPQIDSRFDAIVDKAMQTDRELRYSTATEIKMDVEKVRSSSAPLLAVQPSVVPASPAPSQAGPKSGIARLAGIAAGVIVLGTTAFYAMRQQPASSPTKVAVTAEDTRIIRLWDSPEKVGHNPQVEWKDGIVHLKDNEGLYAKPLSRDAAIRASIRMNGDAKGPQINLRHLGEKHYRLALNPKDNYVVLGKANQDKMTSLKTWPLPRRYQEHEWVRLELRAVGDQLTAFAEGKELGTASDSEFTEPGSAAIFATNGYFRDIEYIPLDESGLQSPLPAWQKLSPPDASFLAKSEASINAAGEWNVTRGLTLTQVTGRNIAIRGELKRMPGSTEPLQVVLRHGGDSKPAGWKAGRSLVLYPSMNLLQLNRSKPESKTESEYLPLTRGKYAPGADPENAWLPFTYAVVGSASMARLGGMSDLLAGYSEDGRGLGAIHLQGGLFRNLEYIDLDHVSEDSATELLGMKQPIAANAAGKPSFHPAVFHIPGLPDLPPLTIPPGEPGFVKEINFKGLFLHRFSLLPDCRRLLVYQDRTISLFDMEKETSLWSTSGGTCRSSSVSKDGSRVAEFRFLDDAGQDSNQINGTKAVITLRSTSNGQEIQSWVVPVVPMGVASDQLALSPSGKRLVARVGGNFGNNSQAPCLFVALEEGKSDPIAQWTVPNHNGHVTSCLDEDRFVSTGNGAPILLKISDPGHFEPLLHDLAELRNAISPDNKVIVARHRDTMALWDIESCNRLFFFERGPGQPHSISFAGNDLVVAVGDQAVYNKLGTKSAEYVQPLGVWDRSTGKQLVAYTAPQPDQRFYENVRGAANGTFCVVRVRHYPIPPGGDGNLIQIYRLPKPGEVHNSVENATARSAPR